MTHERRFSIGGIIGQRSVAQASPARAESPPTIATGIQPLANEAGPLRSPVTPQKIQKARPKAKKSHTLTPDHVAQLEIIAWYLGRSASSVLDELLAKFVAERRELCVAASAAKSQAVSTSSKIAAAG